MISAETHLNGQVSHLVLFVPDPFPEPWSSIRRRKSMYMWCLDDVGREIWEWVVTTFGRLSRLMLPPRMGEEALTEVCLLSG